MFLISLLNYVCELQNFLITCSSASDELGSGYWEDVAHDLEYQSFEDPLEYQDAQENLEYQNIGENNFVGTLGANTLRYNTMYIATHLYCCAHGRMEAGGGFEHET
jgi:hypothetical protein